MNRDVKNAGRGHWVVEQGAVCSYNGHDLWSEQYSLAYQGPINLTPIIPIHSAAELKSYLNCRKS